MTVDQNSQVDAAGDTIGAGGEDNDASLHGRRRRWRSLLAGGQWVRLRGRRIRRRLPRSRFILLIVAVVASVGFAGGLFVFQYRPDQQLGAAAADAALAAASEGAVAILSYSPETVDRDVAAANSLLTGEFLRYYREFSQHFVAPAVRQQDVKASATVLRAGVSELHPDSAVVLLFIHQTTTSKDKPEPVLTSSNVRVGLTKVDGTWLISKFEPV